MPGALTILWNIVQIGVGFNLLLPLVVYLIEKIKKQRVLAAVPAEYKPDYAIIITAYKYIDSLPDVVNSVLKINYPNFLVYIVADNCDTSSLNFDDKRVILLRPENILKGNVKSHFFAINRFIRPHDILTIIDSDNIVHPEYLNELNVYFNEGFEAVQGLREAKNLDSTYARLDAARDIYYHYYDCKLLFNGGSSSTLSGSGMAFTVKLYKDSLENIKISGAGFDKVLQSQIVLQNKRIAFAPKAAVYDEKTSRPAELVNQRSRWINTWFKYFKFGFRLAFLGVKNFSLNQFLFGLVLLRPPLFLFLIASVMLMLANIFINPLISLIWLAGLIIFTGCFMLALISSNTDKRIYKALIDVPKFMFYQIVSLTKVRKANVRSVSTRHNHT